MQSYVSKCAWLLQNSSSGRFIISDDAKKCQLAGAQREMGQAPGHSYRKNAAPLAAERELRISGGKFPKNSKENNKTIQLCRQIQLQ